MAKRSTQRGETRICSPEFGVTTVTTTGGGAHATRVQPCEQCPWRLDAEIGRFPAEAYRESAPTAYDMAQATFGCHMSSMGAPATCAGFLLQHGEHNLTVRLSRMKGRLDMDRIHDGGHPLHPSYRHMAIANGVAADDPLLVPVRASDEVHFALESRYSCRPEQEDGEQ